MLFLEALRTTTVRKLWRTITEAASSVAIPHLVSTLSCEKIVLTYTRNKKKCIQNATGHNLIGSCMWRLVRLENTTFTARTGPRRSFCRVEVSRESNAPDPCLSCAHTHTHILTCADRTTALRKANRLVTGAENLILKTQST